MEQGITEGKIRIISFTGAMKTDISEKSAAFNNPPKVICEANHDGKLLSEKTLVAFEGRGVSVTAIKGAYDGNGEIIRLNEYLGKEQSASLNYFDKEICVVLKPYEIKTLRICNEKVIETNIIEQ